MLVARFGVDSLAELVAPQFASRHSLVFAAVWHNGHYVRFNMSGVLQQYYQGITQQLRSEVDFINSLFEHQGIKGEGNEAILRELLTKFIPRRYGIGTGVVIDRHGKPSRQCDIVIYDTFLYPSLLSLTSVHLFPVDIVYATIEIKTTLSSKTAKEAIDNIASVKSLDFLKMDFGDQWMSGNIQVSGIRATTAPLGFIFAYNSDAQHDETFKKWFAPVNDEDTPLYPSLIGCLDMGQIGFKPETQNGGATGVHPEIGMKPECRTFPVIRKNEDKSVVNVESAEDVQFLKVSGPISGKQFLPYQGVLYPVKKIGKDYMAIDQSRVLLNFLLLLNDLLAHKKIHPSISFLGTYMKYLDMFHFVF